MLCPPQVLKADLYPRRAWEQFLEEVQKGLPLRVYGAAVISMHELGVQLMGMQAAWLVHLRRPAANS